MSQTSPETETPTGLIDKRLADLREANDIFRASSWDRCSAIERNQREISWLTKLRTVFTSALAPRPAVQEALEHARAYIDADVESMEPGWRSAKAIVELIDAALSDTSTDRGHELVAFLAIWAVQYAKDHELDGLHPTHFDLMVKYGARMNDFKRATNAVSSTDRPEEITKAEMDAIEAAAIAGKPLTSTDHRVTSSSGCVFCDIGVTLHHDDVSGFHHVAGGETIACSLSSPACEGK